MKNGELIFSEVKAIANEKNCGKGAALRNGFQFATGDYVAVQDADMEYDPNDLKRLIMPLIENNADVVFGSRFLSHDVHRVLYFWHYMGNRFLTLLSNMFTDINLTDMETCYKVFRREVIQNIQIQENRFGFEPEIVAKVSHKNLRLYEMGISYHGRTYEEGKKIGVKDGFRALYCILKYNAYKNPMPIQFLLYLFIGFTAACVNWSVFGMLHSLDLSMHISVPVAFIVAAIVNYLLCIMVLFRHKARWDSFTEIFVYAVVVISICMIDLICTKSLYQMGFPAIYSKITASLLVLVLNYLGRRLFVFPER
jgi:glycosyltransferase involved in cell wall biosynthesis